MFYPQIEEPLTLKQAAKLPMLRKNGKPIHVATLFRWTTCGCRGVVLESIQIGGSRSRHEVVDDFTNGDLTPIIMEFLSKTR